MRVESVVVLAVIGCCVGACAPEAAAPKPAGCVQPESVAKMCDVDRLAGIAADAEPFEVGAQRSNWIATNVHDPEAIELRVRLSVLPAEEQGKRLRQVARESGIARCDLADTLEQRGIGGLAP
jgi:hypothetical protein